MNENKELVIGRCPACGETLSVPVRLEQFSCMFCGAKLSKGELITDEKREKANEELQEKLNAGCAGEELDAVIQKIREEDFKNPEANAAYARAHFNELLFSYPDGMKMFTRKSYAPYFEQYCQETRHVTESLFYAMQGPDKEALATELAENLVAAVVKETGTGRKMKQSIQMNLKMRIVVYVVPMLMRLENNVGEPVCDAMIKAWAQAYPKETPFNKGDFDEINSGFKKGKLCFITTAVCESFGKPDDCYELESFRRFRDTKLLPVPYYRELVEEYYDIAPAIVMSINREENRDELYYGIWERYLSPCLTAIEEGRDQDCADTYVEMVRTLENRYLN